MQDEVQQEQSSAYAASKRGLVLEYDFKPGSVEQHQGDVVGHSLLASYLLCCSSDLRRYLASLVRTVC